ncbi:MAG: OmpA family protein [Flammeovirgaceae bacterium]|nr:OmpA family protein [Flammeovirgaceae bacterium]
MRVLGFFLIGILSSSILCAQDTLIYATGTIVSAQTKEPIEAKISFQSLPYGSRLGFQKGTSFSFPMYDHDKYSVTIEAPGYAPSKYMLDPDEANADRKVVRNIELELPKAAEDVAEETHTVGKVLRLENLIFEQGKSKIDRSSFEELDRIVTMLNKNPRMVIQLEGHTDFLGSPAGNMKLSEDRVKAVKNYLLSKGISKHKVKTVAYGGTQPLSHENTEEAHAMNRRVEVRILQN